MEFRRIEPFVHYYGRLRERTMAVVELVPPERIDWSPGSGALTFGDILRHLAGIERWVFTENAHGRPPRYPGHDRDRADGHQAVIAYFVETHRESLDLLGSLTPDQLEERCETPGGTRITAWKWLRALAEHEIHHRGQIYLMLRLVGVETPPLYGLTAEQVRARSRPQP
jgi:uncharacterized damage-inducible protein DinB